MSFRLRPDQDALFLDVDGTLLDIASTPNKVTVPPSLIKHLAVLYTQLDGALALISGRTIKDIDTLFPSLKLPASGVHGAQFRTSTHTFAHDPLPISFRQAVKAALAAYPSLLVEDKDYSMAVHYRQTPEMADAIESLLEDVIAKSGLPLLIMPGKMVFEVLYPWHNKGAAIEYFMASPPFAGRRPVFLGDDETDISAIGMCLRLGGIATRIGSPCDKFFLSPAFVREWIAKQL